MATRAERPWEAHHGRAVFVCSYHEPLRSTILPLAEQLRVRGNLQPRVVLEDDAAARMQRMCEAAAVPWRHVSGRSGWPRSVAGPPPMPPQSSAARGRRAGPTADRDSIVRRLLRFGQAIWKLHRQIRRQVCLLRELRAEVLVLLDDRTLHGCRWVRAAQRLNIPVIVVQWAATHRASTLAALRAVRQVQAPAEGPVALLERFVARKVPHAVRQLNCRRVWWIPPEVTLAHHCLGAFPSGNPWTYGGGNSSVVTVLGKAWKKRFVEDGVAAEKLVITGHPEQDRWYRLAAERKEDRWQTVARDLGIAADKCIVTVIAPAMVLRGPGGARQDDIAIADLREDLRAVVQAILDLDKPAVPVVKVHPRDSVDTLSFLLRGMQTAPCIVGDYPLERLIAASRAMACQWSTAAMMGQALGVPVLVFDFHHSPSADVWKGADGLHHVQSIEQFGATLRRCLGDASDSAKLLAGRRRFVDQYLRLDGKASARITALIEQQAVASARN